MTLAHMSIKNSIRALVPRRIWLTLSNTKQALIKVLLSRRSLRRKFTDIYQTDVWRQSGKEPFKFYSGRGSDDEFTREYLSVVSEFIRKNGARNVLDIGCGDFRVGKQLVLLNPQISYIGIDIVEPLIRHNAETFASMPNVKFLSLNAATDALPDADLVLIRQVLQHLSNRNISLILQKLRKFKWVLASDAVPPKSHPSPNEDMADGHVVRERGLFLEEAPFNVACSCILITSIRRPDGDIFEDIRTMLISYGV